MSGSAVADYGPLIAFLDRSERHDAFAVERVKELAAPLLVCDPVLVKATYPLSGLPHAQGAFFGLLENGALRLAFDIGEHVSAVCALHRKYCDRPMSLADACILRMAELFQQHQVLTLDTGVRGTAARL